MFRALLDSPYEVAGLITRPTSAAKGREKSSPNPMQDTAAAHGVPVHVPESINSGQQLLTGLAPDLMVVCDYGQILSPEVLAIPPLGGINLHASLLPRYRGAAPIQWAIFHGETETGVSVIHMTPRLDAGPILAMRKTPIGPEETHPELEQRLALLGIEAVQEAIGVLMKWDRSSSLGTPQDATLASKAPRLKKEQGVIHWSRAARQIHDQVRAFKPWPGTFTFWRRAGQEPLRLVVDQTQVGSEPLALASAAGTVLVSDGKELIIATGDQSLSLRAVQPAGKRLMPVADFLRGYPVREGDRFGSE
jgi:methionyl-tRNA formyltransferase